MYVPRARDDAMRSMVLIVELRRKRRKNLRTAVADRAETSGSHHQLHHQCCQTATGHEVYASHHPIPIMPSSNMIRPHAALRRATLLSRAPPTTAAAFSARVSSPRSLAVSRGQQKRMASGGKPNGKDFMGQLYDSTQARLQRENAEQARYAAQRDLTGRGSKGAGLLARETIPQVLIMRNAFFGAL